MLLADEIAIVNIGATVLAVITAPVIALWAGHILQKRSDAREQQLKLLSVLLSLRHVPLSPENFRILNMIDVVFVYKPSVRKAWIAYFSSLADQTLNTNEGYSVRESKRLDLMNSIVVCLGLQKYITSADLRRTYSPTAVTESEHLAIWEKIKRREDLRAEFIARDIGFPAPFTCFRLLLTTPECDDFPIKSQVFCSIMFRSIPLSPMLLGNK